VQATSISDHTVLRNFHRCAWMCHVFRTEVASNFGHVYMYW